MFNSLSLSGAHRAELYSVEVTLMDAGEYPPPLNKYLVFDIAIRCKDTQQSIDVSDFTFYLMVAGRVFNSVDTNQIPEIHKYVDDSGMSQMFNGKATVGFCEQQHILVLFEPIEAVHYRESAILYRYKENKQIQ